MTAERPTYEDLVARAEATAIIGPPQPSKWSVAGRMRETIERIAREEAARTDAKARGLAIIETGVGPIGCAQIVQRRGPHALDPDRPPVQDVDLMRRDDDEIRIWWRRPYIVTVDGGVEVRWLDEDGRIRSWPAGSIEDAIAWVERPPSPPPSDDSDDLDF